MITLLKETVLFMFSHSISQVTITKNVFLVFFFMPGALNYSMQYLDHTSRIAFLIADIS